MQCVSLAVLVLLTSRYCLSLVFTTECDSRLLDPTGRELQTFQNGAPGIVRNAW